MTLSFDPSKLIEDAAVFDPNTWDWTEREYRVWVGPQLVHGFLVDYVDYVWATRWLWNPKYPKRGNHRKKMVYCYRTKSFPRTGDFRNDVSMYLHIEIMKRTGIEPPSPLHMLVDHIDGDTLNCTRINLQWATYAMNRVRGNKT